MVWRLPCEAAIRIILPAVKAQIAKNLKQKNIKQKDIANLLDVTAGAVSQYMWNKKGAAFKFSDDINQMIKIVSDEISKGKNPELLRYGICHICKEIRRRGEACRVCNPKIDADYDCSLCKSSNANTI